MVNIIRAHDPRGLDKIRGSKFVEGSRVRQETPEEGQNVVNTNKDEDKNPKTLNDENPQTSFQKFQLPKIVNPLQYSKYWLFEIIWDFEIQRISQPLPEDTTLYELTR